MHGLAARRLRVGGTVGRVTGEPLLLDSSSRQPASLLLYRRRGNSFTAFGSAKDRGDREGGYRNADCHAVKTFQEQHVPEGNGGGKQSRHGERQDN